MIFTEEQQNFIDSNASHLLLIGGPGSGKTTISICKAAKIITDGILKSGQKILFLSFARASVARISEALNTQYNGLTKYIEINTYHAFFWQIITTHGYLLGLPRQLSVLLPHDEAILLSDIPDSGKQVAKSEIAVTQGRISFDLFAQYVNAIFDCQKILTQISDAYPSYYFG